MLSPVKSRALTASFDCYFLLRTDIPFPGLDSLPEKHRDTVAKKDAVAVEKMPKRTARPNVMSDTEMEVIIILSSHKQYYEQSVLSDSGLTKLTYCCITLIVRDKQACYRH